MIYLKDGNIPLSLAYDDDIVQEANSTYQLSFKFPLTDGKWNLLKREVFLLADDLHGEQEFFIFEAKKANGYVQVYAKQVATLLNYYSINTISVDRVPGQTVMTALAGSVKRPCPFTFFSDILDRHTFNESNVSVMDALAKEKHSILGQWGGDLVREKYQVKLLKNGGIENESLFMYKKNLSNYEESENINNLKTRLHLKKTIQGQSEGEEDRVLAVTVDSPLINQYSQIYEADIEVNDQDVTDVASLTAYGQRYFSSTLCDLVENSINLDVKGKSDVAVKMFDTVSVFHERFDVDLRLKITSYHFGPMSKRLKSIGFGKVSQSFGSTVASMVAGSVDKATGRLSASFERKLQKEIDNANRHFDAEFNKRVEEINDGIEQSKADAEAYADNIKQQIDGHLAESDRQYQLAQQNQDRQIADILSKATANADLANAAKQLAEQAKADLAQTRTTISQLIDNTDTITSQLERSIGNLRTDVTSQAQTILAQARAQADLTSRVATVETAANGTKSTVTELQKTLNKATGDIASVTSRTKTVEDNLSQTRAQYEAVIQTVNGHTGQIDSISRRTGTIEAGLTGVTERFEKLRFNNRNYFRGYQLNEEIAVRNYGPSAGFIQIHDKITADLVGTVGETYTISFEVISPNGDATVRVYNSNGYPSYFSFVKPFSDPVGSVWKKYSYTFTNQHNPNGSATTNYNRLEFYFNRNGCRLRNIKIEKGSFATDWCPADEDVNAEIASYKRTAEESSAELQRQIQLVDGKVVDAKNYAQQIAEGFRTRIESLETYNNAEGTRASQYFAASRDETARQVSALRTAVTDGYVAKAKYEEDARGVMQRFESLSVGGSNKFSLSNTVMGGYKDSQGNTVNHKDYSYSQLIPIDSNHQYIMQAWSQQINNFSWVGTIQLDADRNFITGSYTTSYPARNDLYYKLLLIPKANAKYIQISFSNDVFGSNPNLKIKLEKGTIASDWSSALEDQQSYTDTKIAEYSNTVDGRFATMQSQVSGKANQVDLQTVRETVNLYERIIGSTETGIKDKVARMVMTDSLFLTEVKDKISGTATQVNQLNNSYAIKNLTSNGQILNQINLLANGTNRIDGRLTHITGQTLIDNAVITSAMIASMDAGKITTGYLAAARIATNSITGDKLVFDQAFFNKISANEAMYKQLFAKNAFITSVQAVTLSASQIVGGLLRATNGAVEFDLNQAIMTFNSSATIEFNSSGNALVRRVGDVTGFLHFSNASSGGTYVGLGVTSHNEGVKSQNTGRFAGVRIFRSNDSVDQTEIYGDKIYLGHGFGGNAVVVTPTKLDATYELVDVINSIKALWSCWLHWNNVGWNPDDMNMRRAVINEYNLHNIG